MKIAFEHKTGGMVHYKEVDRESLQIYFWGVQFKVIYGHWYALPWAKITYIEYEAGEEPYDFSQFDLDAEIASIRNQYVK